MEMKGFMLNQQQQQQVVEENMSNLTSASGEASASSGNRTELGTSTYPQQYLAPPPTQTQPAKKKRNLPGNPDPDAEVIALSPKSLLATNRFICEICNKGFQRDQNLQLHRRGHNLPWKLKQRTSKEVRKKVYVCPEPTCVHHDPSRALGDLTGIKKHFCRKHGEKKWKCDKCSKKYAVQSDWKAHSKTCGTREYRCDCGTLFSRRDSFITHRAFCDALAEESARAMGAGTGNNTLLPPQPQPSTSHHITQFNPQDHMHAFPLKKEQQGFNVRPEILPPWLGPPITVDHDHDHLSSSSIMFSPSPHQENPNPSLGPTLAGYQTVPHMSATALLQKAAEMGATMTRPHHHAHVSSSAANNFGFNLSSREDTTTTTTTTTSTTTTATLFNHGLLSSHKAAAAAALSSAPSLLHDVINSFSSPSAFEGTPFEDVAFGGIKKDADADDDDNNNLYLHDTFSKTSGAGNEGLTRDFLGLRPLSHSDILTIAGIGNCIHDQQNQSQKPWQG
ncbi:protein indeterminate-domain 7 [Cajanus cajan]|uniref:protein indeterminate-domain 7 n=1 Tax=Cajanus cajan TaxID=3821 RepID=UPI00098D7E06|nr:protein indeterminate-domain 7 [Cajanus cajan]